LVQRRHAKSVPLHISGIYTTGENYKNSAKEHQKPTKYYGIRLSTSYDEGQ
jgi:hypothetical protein